jgi:serine/threonine protein kinase
VGGESDRARTRCHLSHSIQNIFELPKIVGPLDDETKGESSRILDPDRREKKIFAGGLPEVIHGKYRLIGEIGTAPPAVLIVARDEQLDRYVTIKSLTDPKSAGLFDDAVRRAVKITRHPNIISIYGAWLNDKPHHYVRQYVEGNSLRIELECHGQKPLPIDFIQHVLASVGDAMSFAQEQGVNDLNIKPENILIQTREKELSLGLASSYDILLSPENGDKEVLKQKRFRSAMKKSLIYFPPELFQSARLHARDQDKVNQYRLGIVGYEMLIGSTCFQKLAKPRSKKLAWTRSRPELAGFPAWPPVATTRRAGCPKFISESIDRMIDPNPNKRFETLHDAVAVIAHCNVDVEVTRDSYRRILDDSHKERQFFRTFYNRFLEYCPPAGKKFEDSGFPNRSALNDLEANDPKGKWPRQFMLLKESIVLLLAFKMLDESQEPTILTRIAEKHTDFPKWYFDAFRRALVETVLEFDHGNYEDELRHAWEKTIAQGIDYMINFKSQMR